MIKSTTYQFNFPNATAFHYIEVFSLTQIMNFLQNIFNGLVPQHSFWRGSTYGLIAFTTLLAGIAGYHFRTGVNAFVMAFAWMTLCFIAIWLIIIFIKLLFPFLGRLPQTYLFTLLSVVIALVSIRYLRFNLPDILFYPGGFIYLIANSILLGSIWNLFLERNKDQKFRFTPLIIVVVITLNIYGVYWTVDEGSDYNPVEYDTRMVGNEEVSLQDPSQPGPHQLKYFTYGSGTDQQRKEYEAGIRFQTQTVDASLLLPEWKGDKAKWRERYWGFGVSEFPLNGRVWFPEGSGPFPLVLIVHGNHSMEHHSDPGYAYLGEHLASRGFIAVSVDENFINGTWSGDFRGKEMPARGWLLLKHLEVWRNWNQNASHDLFGKVDMENIILMGHSRGGEAVPIAAAYNGLKYFPDNANEKFNFDFNIKGLVAIAPTDKRYDRRIELENINYLSLQGSYDSDEASFFGLRQSQRINFTDSNRWFKSGVYIHGANHGQFNTIWGRMDSGAPWNWILNLKPIIPGEEQLILAKIFIGAFTEMVFNGKSEYSQIFEGNTQSWAPKVPIIYNYKTSDYKPMVSFEEDIDVTTWDRGVITSYNLESWKEQELKFRDKDTQGVNGVLVGWKYEGEMNKDNVASYRINFEETGDLNGQNLIFNMATVPDEEKDNIDSSIPVNFSILLTDSLGNSSQLKLSSIKSLMPPLNVQYLKLEGVNKEVYTNTWEAALEDVRIGLNRFGNKVDLSIIKQIQLIFDQTDEGKLFINEIGVE